MVDPRCRVKRVSGFSSAHFSFALHTFGRLSDHGISSSRKSVVLSSMCGIIVSSTCLKYVVGTQSVHMAVSAMLYRIPLASAPFFVAEICQFFFPTQNFLMLRSQAYADIRIRCVVPDFMKLLSGGIKKGEAQSDQPDQVDGSKGTAGHRGHQLFQSAGTDPAAFRWL